MLIKLLLLASLIKLLIASEKPMLCSGIYASVILILGLAMERHAGGVLLSAGIGFALASLYFWFLNRLDAGSPAWWGVAFAGLAIGLV